MSQEPEQDRHSNGETDPYRELFERSADAILIIDGETFVDCNQATVEMLRYENKEDLLRTHPSELSPPTQPDGRDSFEKANEMIAVAFERGSHRFEWAHQRADGEVFPVEVLLTAVPRGDRHILHVVWRDITERKRLEEELRHAQKMEAIGKLTGGIAHDFNNLLVAIVGNASLLEIDLQASPRQLEYVREISKAGARAASLVQRLLAFSRKEEIAPRVLDVNHLVGEMDKLLGRLIGEDVELVTTLADGPVRIEADPGQIEQVIVNLVTNARDAMPRGGTVTIEVRSVELGPEVIGAAPQLEPGRYAMLVVSDTGEGMDPETARRAFDPFFTTKEPGKGTGLGLSTVYGIVHRAGGGVHMVSSRKHGTVVMAWIPLSDDAVTPVEDREKLPSRGGSESILVAEDESAVSTLVVRVLREKGYRVTLARDGEEALRRWLVDDGAFDLLLTDVVMPRMGGVELVQEIRREGFQPRVLFASGYTDNALADLRNLGESPDLLQKPFSAEQLIGRVRLSLDRG